MVRYIRSTIKKRLDLTSISGQYTAATKQLETEIRNTASENQNPFWSYLQNNTANPAHLPQKWAKRAELAVQLSCIHCYLSPHIFWT